MVDLVNTPDEGNPAEIETPEASIPENYQGKSIEEVIAMHQNAEKLLGRQSEELGSLRSLAEQSITAGSTPEAEPVDFYEDPEKAIERIIEAKLAPFNASLKSQNEAAVRERLDATYPDWEPTVKSEEFQNWVAESEVRTKLFVAANGADWKSANELLGTWAKINGSEKAAKKASTKAVDRDRKLRAAKTEKGSSGIDPRKILSRADLRTLKQTNPTRYNELGPEIRKAYAEGRVR